MISPRKKQHRTTVSKAMTTAVFSWPDESRITLDGNEYKMCREILRDIDSFPCRWIADWCEFVVMLMLQFRVLRSRIEIVIFINFCSWYVGGMLDWRDGDVNHVCLWVALSLCQVLVDSNKELKIYMENLEKILEVRIPRSKLNGSICFQSLFFRWIINKTT